MRSFGFDLTAEQLGLGYMISITRRDGVVDRFTTAQADITIDGVTWTAEPGVEMSKIEYRADGSVANAEIKIATRSTRLIDPDDVKQLKYTGATIQIHLVQTIT